MKLRDVFFKKKTAIRPESVKSVNERVIAVDFSQWIQQLKKDAPQASIRVKRLKQFKLEGGGYIGDPILVNQMEASTFDRILYDLYGGGTFVLEYWVGDTKLMMKNAVPPMSVTHTIEVAGEPKQLGTKKSASEIAAQPKGVLATLLKQLDTAEGIVALTALIALAKDFFQSTKASGGIKELLEGMGVMIGMMPAPPDEIEQLERYQKLSGMFAANRPPVNVGGASGSAWDSVAKVFGQVLGAAIANAQGNGQKPEKAVSEPQILPASASAAPQEASVDAKTAKTTSPQALFVNAKIMSIQTGMKAMIEPYAIANDIWSLLVFIIENKIVNEQFVSSLYADPEKAFDQIIAMYAPASAEYPKLDEVKKIVVGYILEEPEEEGEPESEIQTEGASADTKSNIVDMPDLRPKAEQAQVEIKQEPVVISQGDNLESEGSGVEIPADQDL